MNDYEKSRVSQLETSMRSWMAAIALATGESKEHLTRVIENIDFEELFLGICVSLRNIYGYVVHGEDGDNPVKVDYRCNLLFSQPGCFLMEIPEWDVNITANNSVVCTKEIWVLQDMSLASVKCCGVHSDRPFLGCEYRERAGEDYWTEFDSIKLEDLEKILQHYAHYRKYITDAYHIVTEDS
jgi:hypothetical protein